MPNARLGGIECHWMEDGEGDQTFLLHPALARSSIWTGLSRRLAGRRLIMPDLPGHGQSGDPDYGQDVPDQCVEMLYALWQHLGSRNIEIVAHSFSGALALRLAQAGIPVSRLTLIEPVLFAAAAKPMFDTYVQSARSYNLPLAEEAWDSAARAFLAEWGEGTPWHRIPSPQRAYMIARMRFVASTEDGLMKDTAGILAKGALEGIKVPTLLIEGSESPRIISAIQDTLVGRLPNAQRTIIMGAGHMLPLTHSKSLALEVSSLSAL